jgi:hypothetical protein
VGTTYKNMVLSTPTGGLTLSRTVRLPDATGTIALLDVTQTITGAQTFRNGAGIRVEAASTQDAIVIDGRSGGTSSYASTFIPTTLTANRTITVPNATGTIAFLDFVSLGTRTAAAGNGTLTISAITSYNNLLFEFIYFDATNRHIDTLLVDKDVFDVSSTRRVSLSTPGQTARVEVAYASDTTVTVTFTSAGTSSSTVLTIYGVI